MRRVAASACTILLTLTLVAAGGQPPAGGTVTGHVTLTKRTRGAALPSTAYPSRAVGRRTTAAAPEIRNVVVYLKDPAFRGTLPARRAELRQTGEMFVPHVLAITRGSTVAFPNDDPYFHNVFSLSGAASFNLGRYPKGESRSQTFTRAGIVKVFCQIHSQMSATILVFDHPYFVIPGDDGNFELPALPGGDYTVVGWHERVGERHAAVHVRPGETTQVELSLPVEDTP